MKLTPKLLLALTLALGGLVLVFVGAMRHEPLVVLAGWLILSCCGFLIAAIIYRHVTTLLLRVDALSAAVRQLGGQVQATAKASAKQLRVIGDAQEVQSRTLAGLQTAQTAALQVQGDVRAQLQRLDEMGRAASRQSADSQHFVLGAFRELTSRHQQQDQALKDARNDFQKGSAELVRHVEKQAGATLSETRSELQLVQGKMLSEIGRSKVDVLHETESMLQLMRLFALRGPMPLLGGWAMEPSSMLALVSTILRNKPELVVECGSGTSTLWLAYALAANGKGRLVSLDHEAEYAAATARALAAHDLEHLVDLRLAPLVAQSIGGEEFRWYDPAQLDDLGGTDILIVDGPPSSSGPLARYPAIPLLGKNLSDRAVVIVDDANRKDEKTIMRRWIQELPGLGEPSHMASRTAVIDYLRVAG